MILWMNGNYITETEARISPFDHGFLYGLHFSEKFRTYKGQVVLFHEHYHRLLTILNQFHIKMPYTVTEILQVIHDLTQNANGQDSIFSINVSAGNGQSNLYTQSSYDEPNVIVYRMELPSRNRGKEKSAKWIITQETEPFKNKHLGMLEVGHLEDTEGFFLSEKGIVTEAIASNIFFAKDGIIYTPSLTAGIRAGITRQWVIHTAKQIGYRVVEDLFIKKDLEDAYECFVTNPIDELVPISHLGDTMFLGSDGSIYQRLHQLYIDEILRTVKKGE